MLDPATGDNTRRFILFRGNRYYSSGGWNDLHAAYDNADEALTAAKAWVNGDNSTYGWAHVVDIHTGQLLAKFDCADL